LLPSVQNLFFFATADAVCFDYASAIDIVSGADAQGWPTNHFTEFHHCEATAVRVGTLEQ
jgi:hypothetical protein